MDWTAVEMGGVSQDQALFAARPLILPAIAVDGAE